MIKFDQVWSNLDRSDRIWSETNYHFYYYQGQIDWWLRICKMWKEWKKFGERYSSSSSWKIASSELAHPGGRELKTRFKEGFYSFPVLKQTNWVLGLNIYIQNLSYKVGLLDMIFLLLRRFFFLYRFLEKYVHGSVKLLQEEFNLRINLLEI